MKELNTAQAWEIVGGLSKPGKMPGWSIGLPAKPDVFRWHDSGDVQSLDHLNKIFEVCKRTPSRRHWMPTKEAWIKDHLHRAPKNLTIRISSPMVDQGPIKSWPNTSTVVTKKATCPAPQQGGQCLDCRKCWNPKIKNISYGEH